MKRKHNKKSHRVNQVDIEFTKKPITAWGGIARWNGSGDTGAAQGAVDFFRQIVKALGEKFRIKRVLCDSGFYQVEFIKHLESRSLTYIIAAPISQILQVEDPAL